MHSPPYEIRSIAMLTRNEKILRCITPATQVGVEIGPLDKPIVTRQMGQIYYIDHDSTEVLRSRFQEPGHQVNVENIVDVDYVWGEKDLVELLQNQAPVDYVVASHVIEHVPDLIGWLHEIRGILKPGGILSLVIPDKRQCFDYYRPPTRLPEIAEAYLHRSRKPTCRQIFDHVSSAVAYRGSIAWSGVVNEAQLVPLHNLETAWQTATTALASGNYCDVHCWVFTPNSFFQLLGEMAAANLLKFEVVQFYQTDGCEFFVSLRATDRAQPDQIHRFVTSLPPELARPIRRVFETGWQELRFLKQKLQAVKTRFDKK